MIVTHILQADAPTALNPILQASGYLRADIWRRYGALGALGKSATAIRSELTGFAQENWSSRQA